MVWRELVLLNYNDDWCNECDLGQPFVNDARGIFKLELIFFSFLFYHSFVRYLNSDGVSISASGKGGTHNILTVFVCGGEERVR